MMLLLSSLFFMKNKTQKGYFPYTFKKKHFLPDPINPVLYIHIFLHTPLQVKVIRSAFYLTRVKLLKNKIHKIFHEMEKKLTHLVQKNVPC